MKIADIRTKAAQFLQQHFSSSYRKGSFFNRLVSVIGPSKPKVRNVQPEQFGISLQERSIQVGRPISHDPLPTTSFTGEDSFLNGSHFADSLKLFS